jgi:hypothetical protein
MIIDRIDNDSDALRELARWILRDGIDCDRLEDYMRSLLDGPLIELNASCRYGAMAAVECCAGLGALEVARYLREIALHLECENPAVRRPRMLTGCHGLPLEVSTKRRLEPIQNITSYVLESGSRSSWLPELIASVAFITVGILLMPAECGNEHLRILAASMYVIVGVTHAGVGIYSAWRAAHPEAAKLQSNH